VLDHPKARSVTAAVVLRCPSRLASRRAPSTERSRVSISPGIRLALSRHRRIAESQPIREPEALVGDADRVTARPGCSGGDHHALPPARLAVLEPGPIPNGKSRACAGQSRPRHCGGVRRRG
jgi:hypothetical protein